MRPFILQHNIDIIKIFYLVKNFSMLRHKIRSSLFHEIQNKFNFSLLEDMSGGTRNNLFNDKYYFS